MESMNPSAPKQFEAGLALLVLMLNFSEAHLVHG